jgi:hypothetical protein
MIMVPHEVAVTDVTSSMIGEQGAPAGPTWAMQRAVREVAFGFVSAS